MTSLSPKTPTHHGHGHFLKKSLRESFAKQKKEFDKKKKTKKQKRKNGMTRNMETEEEFFATVTRPIIRINEPDPVIPPIWRRVAQ